MGILLFVHLAAGALLLTPVFAAPDDAPPDAVSDPLPLRKPSASKPKAAAAKQAKRKAPAAETPLAVRTVRTLRVDTTPVATAAPLMAEPAAKPIALVTAPAASPDNDVQQFCGHVGKAATDARVAWQTARLAELETTLKARVAELEAKIAEHRQWLARRDDAARRASESVVAIYARMKPDAAALQIAALDDASAAALLLKLNPRVASAILGEIPAERAARLTDAISGGRNKLPDEKTNS